MWPKRHSVRPSRRQHRVGLEAREARDGRGPLCGGPEDTEPWVSYLLEPSDQVEAKEPLSEDEKISLTLASKVRARLRQRLLEE
jgi:hypothetical protein